MKIVNNFLGANVDVVKMHGDTVELKVELRDTVGDWFYWCFAVVGAEGRTLTFRFENNDRVGYYGAAVSHDFKNWHWQYDDKGHEGAIFRYTFAENEREVYFAHHMLYRPERFQSFAQSNGIDVKPLCVSIKGRTVPYVDTQTAGDVIFLTARHHACESTGNFVLEGALLELLSNEYFRKYRIICVPFVDYDGVIDGDQGKNRKPYDHNRDYVEGVTPIYETPRKIREMTKELNVKYALDLHSPWHLGGENDRVFIPIKAHELVSNVTFFSKIWEGKNTSDSLNHFASDDFLPDIGWNKSGTPTVATFFYRKGAKLSFAVETPYFCAREIAFSPKGAVEEGRNLIRALYEYDIKDNT